MDASTRYRFGRCVVDFGRRQVLVDGRPAKVGARAFDLLVALIERRSRVVSKEELLDLVWRDVTVEEGNLQVHIAALRKIIGSDAIVTSAGRGYQFVAQIEDAVAAPAPPEPPQLAVVQDSASSRAPWFRWRRVGIVAAALAGVAALVAGAAMMLAPRPLPSGSPTLAAMPFVNVSGDETSAEFARGLTSDIGADFSHFHDLNIVSAPVTASYARDIDVRQVAKNLNVQYVLTGAVQRQGDAIQASAELTDGASGESVWSNRWQGSVAGDLLAFQADVADSIASTLGSRNFFVIR
jgi:adenylate cyclase